MYTGSGINFRLGHGGRTPLNVVDTIGHGMALIDCDGDGLLDIVFTGPDQVRLYKNMGHFKFTDITAASGLRQKGYWQGCAVGDVDNDGRPDLFIAGKGDAALYRNLGSGHFREMTPGSGLAVKDPYRWNSAALFFDYDHDGRLDLFVGAYLDIRDQSGLCTTGGIQMACAPVNYNAQKGILYHNVGNWRFEPINIGNLTHGKTLGAIAGDLYGDGGTELYLANDVVEGDMLHYLGGGKWRQEGLISGTALNPDGKQQGGMGVSVSDYDGDGRLDMVVGTFCRDPRSLYRNDGNGQFSNMGIQSGISAAAISYVAFGTAFADMDNDGWPDLIMADGHVQNQVQRVDSALNYAEPTQIMRNLGNGRFTDVSISAGPDIMRPIVGRALCIGDLDNDGKLDVVIEDLEGPPLILRNVSPSTGNWLRVRLLGKHANRDGQGAAVLCAAGGRKQVRLATTGGSFFSASDSRIHFGLGEAKDVDSITVRWPGGKDQTIQHPKINKEITVREP